MEQQFSERRTTLGGIQKSSKISYREIPFHMTLLSQFLEFSVELFTFQQSSNFRIPGNSLTICPRFEIFEIVQWKATPSLHLTIATNRYV